MTKFSPTGVVLAKSIRVLIVVIAMFCLVFILPEPQYNKKTDSVVKIEMYYKNTDITGEISITREVDLDGNKSNVQDLWE